MKTVQHIYTHIPFCAKKCIYCDFPIQAIGNKPENRFHFAAIQNQYIDAILKEIKTTFEINNFQRPVLKTIYFGGGTPSLLFPENFRRLTQALLQGYEKKDALFEFSVENEPDSLNSELLCEFKSSGVNRLTIGVQSLKNDALLFLNRNHTRETIFKAFELAIKYFRPGNIGFDVLLGIPGETHESLLQTLEILCSLKPGHISAYLLTVEKSTKLHQLVEKKQIIFDDEKLADFYKLTQKFLSENEFEQYEVSNFYSNKNQGSKSIHNLMYWNADVNFYGFGMGAASLLESHRFTRPSSLKSYYKFIEEMSKNPNLIIGKGQNESVNLNHALKIFFMGSLRTTDGLSKTKIRETFHKFNQIGVLSKFENNLHQLSIKTKGILEMKSQSIKVSPEKFIILNAILKRIFNLIDENVVDVC